MRHRAARIFALVFFILCCLPALLAQTFLTADGQTDTYTLITNVLGAGPETPDCSHPSFGHHITQAMDSDLGKPVFVFHIHVTPDNDRCINFDRQRLEIKTESPSPAAVKAFLNETLIFRWKFKLAAGFQPSANFTHIHQIKAGDGDNAAPIITLTPRKGSPDILQIIHDGGSSGNSLGTVKTTPLAPFVGVWVEAYEKVTFSHTGSYSIEIKRLSDGATLLTYSNSNINMWRTATTFCRPKWGIYRSLLSKSDLRDEDVRFDRFCIAKTPADCPGDQATPDFSTSAAPASQSVVQGGSASYTTNITASNGFNSTVNLGVSGLPSGASASFTPASVSGSGASTLNVSTSSTTPPGSYTLTITGSSGSLSHSTPVMLVVTAVPIPNFTLSASPPSQSVTAGGGTSYTVTVGAINGFSGNVTLSAGSLPTGVTAGFSPNPAPPGSSTLSVSTSASTVAGTYALTITGTNGSLTHSASVSLVVNPITVSCVTAGSTWQNTAITSKTGTLTASFDATPSATVMNSVIGLSHGAQTAYTGFATLARFNSSSDIDARNGGAYAAASIIPYLGGKQYHFRMVINIPAHTYSIFVTPPGGAELTVGANFAFRTEQKAVTSLDHWGVYAASGSDTVCNFAVQ
jgi:hypothetical protein